MLKNIKTEQQQKKTFCSSSNDHFKLTKRRNKKKKQGNNVLKNSNAFLTLEFTHNAKETTAAKQFL